MLYNLGKEFDRERFKTRSRSLLDHKRVVDLTEKTDRTLKQNSYLHMILNLFASEYGCSVEFAKQEFFKRYVNPEIFVVKTKDRILGEVKSLKSTTDVSKNEMATAIDRFKFFSNEIAGVYLPDALSFEQRVEIEQMIERNKTYL